MDYVSPAALGDLLTVQTQIIKLGKVGMSLEQAIYNQETLICSGLVKLAALDSELFTLKAMSDDFLSAIVSP